MLVPSNLKSLYKEEMIEFLRQTKDVCLSYDPEALQLANQVNQLADILQRLDEALLYERKGLMTQELEDLDSARDEALTGMRYGFLMYTFSDDPTKKAAGQILLDHLDSYGTGIARLNYEAESTVIHNFLTDCNTQSALKEALQSISMGDWISRLQNAAEAFRLKYLERIKAQSTAEKTSVNALRPEAMVAYDKLYKRIQAHLELDETAKYEALSKELDTLELRYVQIIRTRKSATPSSEAQKTA